MKIYYLIFFFFFYNTKYFNKHKKKRGEDFKETNISVHALLSK